MRTRLHLALLMFGFLLLTACGGEGGSAIETSTGEIDTSNCTLGTSTLGSCTLN